jgi:hypothetical protein
LQRRRRARYSDKHVIGIVQPLGFDEPFTVATKALRCTLYIAPGEHIRISTRKRHGIEGRQTGSRPSLMSWRGATKPGALEVRALNAAGCRTIGLHTRGSLPYWKTGFHPGSSPGALSTAAAATASSTLVFS